MRARVKRRQRNRRLMIIGVAVLLIAIFAVSAYYLSLPSSLDAYDNKPVVSSTMVGLSAASAPPYGAEGAALDGLVRNTTGSLTSIGKPVVLYVGEEGCPYCAEMRWSLVLALMRFGNFTNLAYMTSSLDGTDYPTFTFHGSTYQSNYLVFAPYELADRAGNTLQTLPANYQSIFNSLSIGGGVPFADFGGKYYTPGALLPTGYTTNNLTPLFGSKNWTQVIASINSGDSLGSLVKAGANVLTATFCKLTGGLPSNVCQQSPINQLGPVALSLGGPSVATNILVVAPERPSITR